MPRRKRYTTSLTTGREGCRYVKFAPIMYVVDRSKRFATMNEPRRVCRVMESNARREGSVPSAPGCLKRISRCLQHLSNRKQRTGGQRSTVMSSDPIRVEHEVLAPFREEAETITVDEVKFIFFDSQTVEQLF